MKVLLRLGVALLPLALTPLLVQVLSGEYLNLGGGEKDLVLILPWFLWSLLFAVSSIVLWRRGWAAVPATTRSALVGVAGILVTAVVLALLGQLGVAGRF